MILKIKNFDKVLGTMSLEIEDDMAKCLFGEDSHVVDPDSRPRAINPVAAAATARDRADALAAAVDMASPRRSNPQSTIGTFDRARRDLEQIKNSMRQSAVGSKEDRSRAEALKAGSRLADLISVSPIGGPVTAEMHSLAAGVRSALGSKSSESRPGRAFARDLVHGGLYIAKGWASGEFEWIYIGNVPGDPARITIKRDGKTSVELLGDHGLAPYDEQGKFWHPTNWTEGTGVGENTGRLVAEAAGRDVGSVEMPVGDDPDEF